MHLKDNLYVYSSEHIKQLQQQSILVSVPLTYNDFMFSYTLQTKGY